MAMPSSAAIVSSSLLPVIDFSVRRQIKIQDTGDFFHGHEWYDHMPVITDFRIFFFRMPVFLQGIH